VTGRRIIAENRTRLHLC